MAKLILQPYYILLFSVIAILLWIVMKYRRLLDCKTRRLMWVGITLLVIMWILSTPVISDRIEKSLYLNSSAEHFRPEVIVILAGGYEPGYSIEQDVLVMETNIRVLTGVKWWKENLDAIMIMSGADNFEGRKSSRQTELMTAMAVNAGVPGNKIIADTLSGNTFEHPQKIMELPGINPQTSVGVVTSKWHMRRAIFSFKQSFDEVYPSPISASIIDNSLFAIQRFIPYPDALSKSTRMIHEWIGILWYKIK